MMLVCSREQYIVQRGLIAFSNLMEASVLNPSLVAVFLICIGSKCATSTSIFFVESENAQDSHQIIPHKARIFLLSRMTISPDIS